MTVFFHNRRRDVMVNELATRGNGTQIPIARMHTIYKERDVEERLSKLPLREHDGLRATYERMLARGGSRFQVKLSSLPSLDSLYEDLPNFSEVIDDVKRQLALCADSSDGLEIAPFLLLGPPGIGKTHFARLLSELLGTGTGFMQMNSLTAGWILSGASSQWRGAKPGKVFETLVNGEYANPVMVADEIDKVGGDRSYDPLGSLYALLEHDTAEVFMDEYAEVAIDTSQAIWIATANEEVGIPTPIINRMNVYEIFAPSKSGMRDIALKLYVDIRNLHDWGEQFSDEIDGDVLDKISDIEPRELRRAWMTTLGNARLAKRFHVKVDDVPKPRVARTRMGFLG